jgi:integrase
MHNTAPSVLRLKALKEQGNEWKPSPWVFISPISLTGRLEEPSIAHRKAIAAAGLPPVSLHGLRRSFGSLSEWCEVPVGVVAQIMGHKPSATAEKHGRFFCRPGCFYATLHRMPMPDSVLKLQVFENTPD